MLNGGRSSADFDDLPLGDIKLLEQYSFARRERKLSTIGKMLGGGKKKPRP